MLTREQITAALHHGLEPLPFIRTTWLGGSDATGRADELSDIDLCLIVSPGHIEPSAEAIERTLESLSPIAVRYRLPMPTWHGFHHAFYQLKDAHEHTMVDWVIVETGQAHPWFEIERHGTPRTLFDKDGLIAPSHVDRAAIDAAIEKKVADLRLRFSLFRHMPVKLIRRGLPVDAAHFYFALVLRPLVDLLRAVHCPDRHDFGFRYIRDDLPSADYETLVRLSRWATDEELQSNAREASDLFEATLVLWDANRSSLPKRP